jgi:hypothetical protein
MTRPSLPDAGPVLRPEGTPAWMTVHVRVQTPLPQGDGDSGDHVPAAWPPHQGAEETGYGHGV